MGRSADRNSAIIESGWIHHDGTRFPHNGDEYERIASDCFPLSSAPQPDTMETCLRNIGITHDYVQLYLPDDFWTLNLIESGIVLSLTTAVVLLGLRWSRTRLA